MNAIINHINSAERRRSTFNHIPHKPVPAMSNVTHNTGIERRNEVLREEMTRGHDGVKTFSKYRHI